MSEPLVERGDAIILVNSEIYHGNSLSTTAGKNMQRHRVFSEG